MTTIAYSSPLVPVEWIAAHGLEPRWLRPGTTAGFSAASGRRGVCPFAATLVEAAMRGAPGTAVVWAITCDQMRHAGSLLEHQGDVPLFLMNVPSTWQTPVARTLYVEELRRLGRFLVRLGGTSPANDKLSALMFEFDRARTQVRQAAHHLDARRFAGALVCVREGLNATAQTRLASGNGRGEHVSRQGEDSQASVSGISRGESAHSGGVRLALVGGPLPETQHLLFDWLERTGARVVLDATETGERTLPRPFHPERTRREPLEELADAYFGSIADVFRRPNDACYDYLGREMAARRVQGVVFRRYLWCDLWHAELARLKRWSPVPVLDLDVAESEASAEGRTLGRIEAFLEMLKALRRAPATSSPVS